MRDKLLTLVAAANSVEWKKDGELSAQPISKHSNAVDIPDRAGAGVKRGRRAAACPNDGPAPDSPQNFTPPQSKRLSVGGNNPVELLTSPLWPPQPVVEAHGHYPFQTSEHPGALATATSPPAAPQPHRGFRRASADQARDQPETPAVAPVRSTPNPEAVCPPVTGRYSTAVTTPPSPAAAAADPAAAAAPAGSPGSQVAAPAALPGWRRRASTPAMWPPPYGMYVPGPLPLPAPLPPSLGSSPRHVHPISAPGSSFAPLYGMYSPCFAPGTPYNSSYACVRISARPSPVRGTSSDRDKDGTTGSGADSAPARAPAAAAAPSPGLHGGTTATSDPQSRSGGAPEAAVSPAGDGAASAAGPAAAAAAAGDAEAAQEEVAESADVEAEVAVAAGSPAHPGRGLLEGAVTALPTWMGMDATWPRHGRAVALKHHHQQQQQLQQHQHQQYQQQQQVYAAAARCFRRTSGGAPPELEGAGVDAATDPRVAAADVYDTGMSVMRTASPDTYPQPRAAPQFPFHHHQRYPACCDSGGGGGVGGGVDMGWSYDAAQRCGNRSCALRAASRQQAITGGLLLPPHAPAADDSNAQQARPDNVASTPASAAAVAAAKVPSLPWSLPASAPQPAPCGCKQCYSHIMYSQAQAKQQPYPQPFWPQAAPFGPSVPVRARSCGSGAISGAPRLLRTRSVGSNGVPQAAGTRDRAAHPPYYPPRFYPYPRFTPFTPPPRSAYRHPPGYPCDPAFYGYGYELPYSYDWGYGCYGYGYEYGFSRPQCFPSAIRRDDHDKCDLPSTPAGPYTDDEETRRGLRASTAAAIDGRSDSLPRRDPTVPQPRAPAPAGPLPCAPNGSVHARPTDLVPPYNQPFPGPPGQAPLHDTSVAAAAAAADAAADAVAPAAPRRGPNGPEPAGGPQPPVLRRRSRDELEAPQDHDQIQIQSQGHDQGQAAGLGEAPVRGRDSGCSARPRQVWPSSQGGNLAPGLQPPPHQGAWVAEERPSKRVMARMTARMNGLQLRV